MNTRAAFIAALLSIGWLVMANDARAASYDLTTGFSSTNNPNGNWSIRYGGNPLAHQTAPTANGNHLIPAIPSDGFLGTGPNLNNNTPFVFKAAVDGSAANGVPGESLNNGDFLAGDIVVHSPNDGSAVTIAWTAPSAGALSNLMTSFWYAHSTVVRSNEVTLTVAGVFISSVPVSNGTNYDRDHAGGSNVIPFSLNAGDLITLSIRTNSFGVGSLTGVAMSFDFVPSTVPIPAALPLFVSSLVGLALVARRKREAAA